MSNSTGSRVIYKNGRRFVMPAIRVPDRRFPFADLERVVDRWVWRERKGPGNRAGGITPAFPNPLAQAYYRCRRTGFVPIATTERFADALGLHPCEIFLYRMGDV